METKHFNRGAPKSHHKQPNRIVQQRKSVVIPTNQPVEQGKTDIRERLIALSNNENRQKRYNIGEGFLSNDLKQKLVEAFTHSMSSVFGCH